MLLGNGTKLCICHRRLFGEDQPRYFFGVVECYGEGIAKVSGFTWTRDPHGYHRKGDRRTKLVSLASGTLIVYQIPDEIDVEAIRIEQVPPHTIVATDGDKFRMDLSERI